MSDPVNVKYIKGPFTADIAGGYIFCPPNGFMFATVRGWGVLGYLKEGAEIQDANLQFMVDALNEKAARDSAVKDLPREGEQKDQHPGEVGQAAQLGDGLRVRGEDENDRADDADQKREVDREVGHGAQPTPEAKR